MIRCAVRVFVSLVSVTALILRAVTIRPVIVVITAAIVIVVSVIVSVPIIWVHHTTVHCYHKKYGGKN